MRGRFLASTSSTIVLGLALALATATLAAAAPPSNLNVTAMPGNEAEDAIAVNPTNPSNVVAMSTLPDALQFDLSMTAATEFRPAGPRFQLLFGETAADEPEPSAPVAGRLSIPTPAVARDIFGWGVIYALHARACIERCRVWQAEHYVGAVRDHALSLACLSRGLPAAQARGYDQLSPETLAAFDRTHVGSLEPDVLRRALGASVLALLNEGGEADLADVDRVAERLVELH